MWNCVACKKQIYNSLLCKDPVKMSKDITVLAPNGRRQIIHCTPDTSILQILETACQKQGYQPSDYDLKHHNHILDLTTTIRFSNLPNKATVEMVEADRKREESNVTVGLLLEDGERRMAEFSPNTSLYDLVSSLAAPELNSLINPTILYMRQEVIGVPALREKTLKHLGLIKGRAILRLLNKSEEAKQANVSAVYRRPFSDTSNTKLDQGEVTISDTPGPSHRGFDPVAVIKQQKSSRISPEPKEEELEPKTPEGPNPPIIIEESNNRNVVKKPEVNPQPCPSNVTSNSSSSTSMTEEYLERRLKIEEEVVFLGTQKAIAYMQPDGATDELEDLPDDFYELTIEEVRKLYNDLQHHRLKLENTPLLTTEKRQELEKSTSKSSVYKNVVVRIQFPDRIILQGVFQPSNTIEDVFNFVKEHLKQSNKPFEIFTTPLKENLDPKMTLEEAKYVPCVHMHFKWVEDDGDKSYLKEEVYTKKTSVDAASILASKYRAPSRRKFEDTTGNVKKPTASTSKNSKVPKWFKN